MKTQILEELNSLNLEEKQDLLFNLVSLNNSNFIKIKDKKFKVNEFEILKARVYKLESKLNNEE